MNLLQHAAVVGDDEGGLGEQRHQLGEREIAAIEAARDVHGPTTRST